MGASEATLLMRRLRRRSKPDRWKRSPRKSGSGRPTKYPDKPPDQSYDAYHKLRAIEYMGGATCVDCRGDYSATPVVLQFDHLPGRVKTDRLSRLWGKPWAEVTFELDKCELVCHNCHDIRTSERGPAGYNTIRAYAKRVRDSVVSD